MSSEGDLWDFIVEGAILNWNSFLAPEAACRNGRRSGSDHGENH